MILNKYLITDIHDESHHCWDKVVQNPATVRRNIEGTKCILKLLVGIDTIPDCLDQTLKLYSHDEIMEVLQSTDWTVDSDNFVEEE